jgi:hypothetical protein
MDSYRQVEKENVRNLLAKEREKLTNDQETLSRRTRKGLEKWNGAASNWKTVLTGTLHKTVIS